MSATAEQIEELERVIAHLEGHLQGHEIDRKRRVEILRAIIERLSGEGQSDCLFCGNDEVGGG